VVDEGLNRVARGSLVTLQSSLTFPRPDHELAHTWM
jgi:hypothetical protein